MPPGLMNFCLHTPATVNIRSREATGAHVGIKNRLRDLTLFSRKHFLPDGSFEELISGVRNPRPSRFTPARVRFPTKRNQGRLRPTGTWTGPALSRVEPFEALQVLPFIPASVHCFGAPEIDQQVRRSPVFTMYCLFKIRKPLERFLARPVRSPAPRPDSIPWSRSPPPPPAPVA